MDKLVTYRTHIHDLLKEYAQYKPSYGNIEVEQIIDTQNDHYQLVTVGWNGYHRVHNCLFHIDIKNGKLWIQHDGTEEGIANWFVERNVPKSDIVLAFYAPYRRQFTDFAVE